MFDAPNARRVCVHESHRIEPCGEQPRHFYSLRIGSRQCTQCTTEFRHHSCEFIVFFVVISILYMVSPHHLNFSSSILRLPRQKVHFFQQFLLMPFQLPHCLLLSSYIHIYIYTPQPLSLSHTHTLYIYSIPLTSAASSGRHKNYP